MDDIDTYDIQLLAGFLERAWAGRDAALSDFERQSWDMIETMILNEPTVKSLTSKLQTSVRSCHKGSFRLAVRVMLTYMEEVKISYLARV